jgi:DNA-binding Lrp family transcriptional regulator
VNKIDTIVSNTDIATALGISFPTAQRLLQSLAEDGHILRVGKKFQKLKNN